MIDNSNVNFSLYVGKLRFQRNVFNMSVALEEICDASELFKSCRV